MPLVICVTAKFEDCVSYLNSNSNFFPLSQNFAIMVTLCSKFARLLYKNANNSFH